MTRNPGVIVACLLVLNGCSAIRTLPPEPPDWDVRRQQLLTVDNWELRGRIAVQSQTGDGGQASLRWKQDEQVSRIRLSGPLGAGSYQLVAAPQRISVTDSGGERSLEYSGEAAAEDFMQDQFGWSFPVTSTRFWMLGLADPSATSEQRYAPDGALGSIAQHGWNIRYQRFAEFDGVLLPTRLELENPRARLRIVVHTWLLAPGGG